MYLGFLPAKKLASCSSKYTSYDMIPHIDGYILFYARVNVYQVNNDDIQDMKELHKVFESLVKAAKEKYSDTIILSALSVTMVDLIKEMSTDREHFLSAKDKFCRIMDIETKRFYG